AEQHARESIVMMPSFWAQIVLGWSYMGKNKTREAVAAMRTADSMSRQLPFARAALAHVLARTGSVPEAHSIVQDLETRARRGYVPAYDIAIVYAGLGDNDRAFEWLAKALAERSMFVVHLAWDARLDPLRSDARFADLLQRLGVPA